MNTLTHKLTPYRLLARCVLLLVALLPLAHAGSLIQNSSFSEDVNADGWPDGWEKLPGSSWHQSDEGFSYLRLEQNAPGKMRMIYLKVPIPEGMSQVILSGKARAEAIMPGKQMWFDARIFSQFLDADGFKMSKGKQRPYIIAKKGSSAWKEFELTYDVPAGAGFLQIMAGHFNTESGIIDIAELALRTAE